MGLDDHGLGAATSCTTPATTTAAAHRATTSASVSDWRERRAASSQTRARRSRPARRGHQIRHGCRRSRRDHHGLQIHHGCRRIRHDCTRAVSCSKPKNENSNVGAEALILRRASQARAANPRSPPPPRPPKPPREGKSGRPIAALPENTRQNLRPHDTCGAGNCAFRRATRLGSRAAHLGAARRAR